MSRHYLDDLDEIVLCDYCEDADATIATTVDGRQAILCADCHHDHVVECDRCSGLIWAKDAQKRLGQILCDDCLGQVEHPQPDPECPF